MRNMIAANWKMHFDINEAENSAKQMASLIKFDEIDIVVCPNFTHLDRLNAVFSKSSINLGAQNMYFEEKGAYTGEVSPIMLRSVGCDYVIIGHSERRHIFGETDELINKKVESAKSHSLKPILCVGETLKEREDSKAFDVIERQIEEGLSGADTGDAVIAYEPVWAIGTGVAADKETIDDVHTFIRGLLKDVPILYGGSVKPSNAEELATLKDVNGFLVGGASLAAEDFKNIIEKFMKIKGED